MKKALIISYYYPPCTGVASFRPLSWSRDFIKHGIKPTIVTRHWNGRENSWEDYLAENDKPIDIFDEGTSKIIRLPYKKNKIIQKIETPWIIKSGISRITHFLLNFRGKFQREVDAEGCFKDFLVQYLSKEKYSLLIVTAPPLNIVSLGYYLHQRFHIPFVVDFRDSWNNLLLKTGYRPNNREALQNKMKEYYLGKWLQAACFTTTVTPAIAELISKLGIHNTEIITNGFQLEDYKIKIEKENTNTFIVSVIGTIHPYQDIESMLEGTKLFLSDKNPGEVLFQFIGISASPEIESQVKQSLPEEFIITTQRVTKEEAIRQTLLSDILLFPSYKGFSNYYTAKIFEYLGSGKNILMVPGNHDMVDDLILTTGAGKIAYNSIQFSNHLNGWFSEWKSTGNLKYNGVPEKINFYSRENQTRILCQNILNRLKT